MLAFDIWAGNNPYLFSPKDTKSMISAKYLNCGLIRPKDFFHFDELRLWGVSISSGCCRYLACPVCGRVLTCIYRWTVFTRESFSNCSQERVIIPFIFQPSVICLTCSNVLRSCGSFNLIMGLMWNPQITYNLPLRNILKCLCGFW